MVYSTDMYPVQFDVEYPEEGRNRLTTLFRLILMIPALVVVALAAAGLFYLSLATALMILFRKKYPRPWFDFHLAIARFSARVDVYTGLLRDEYPSTDEQQAVNLDIAYPDAETQLNRVMPLIKWLLAIPHYIFLFVLGVIAFIVTIIAWFAILIIGRFPRGMFNFVVGVKRWEVRVGAYMFLLATDRYPPFRLEE